MTIEQLEAEGWHRVAVGNEYYVAASTQLDSKWIELGYDILTKHLQVLKANQHPTGFKVRETIYSGKCPDMQTFKYLTTLLDL
jgi:hypothetical protein